MEWWERGASGFVFDLRWHGWVEREGSGTGGAFGAQRRGWRAGSLMS